jgi:hypothetical protein
MPPVWEQEKPLAETMGKFGCDQAEAAGSTRAREKNNATKALFIVASFFIPRIKVFIPSQNKNPKFL